MDFGINFHGFYQSSYAPPPDQSQTQQLCVYTDPRIQDHHRVPDPRIQIDRGPDPRLQVDRLSDSRIANPQIQNPHIPDLRIPTTSAVVHQNELHGTNHNPNYWQGEHYSYCQLPVQPTTSVANVYTVPATHQISVEGLSQNIQSWNTHHTERSHVDGVMVQNELNKSYKTQHSLVQHFLPPETTQFTSVLPPKQDQSSNPNDKNRNLQESQTNNNQENPTVTAEKQKECTKCGESFKTASELKKHLTTHRTKELLTCEVCSKTFKSSSIKKRHMYVHSKEKPFKCDHCDKCFSHNHNRTNHMRVHMSEAERPKVSYKCRHCDEECETWVARKKHEAKVHNIMSQREKAIKHGFRCDLCPRKFYSTSGFFKHKKQHRENSLPENVEMEIVPEVRHKCQYCDLEFHSIQGRVKHEKSYHEKERENSLHFKCRFCDRIYFSEGGRKKHERISHKKRESRSVGNPTVPVIKFKDDDPDVSCPFCDNLFYTLPGRNKHILACHKDDLSGKKKKEYDEKLAKKSNGTDKSEENNDKTDEGVEDHNDVESAGDDDDCGIDGGDVGVVGDADVSGIDVGNMNADDVRGINEEGRPDEPQHKPSNQLQEKNSLQNDPQESANSLMPIDSQQAHNPQTSINSHSHGNSQHVLHQIGDLQSSQGTFNSQQTQSTQESQHSQGQVIPQGPPNHQVTNSVAAVSYGSSVGPEVTQHVYTDSIPSERFQGSLLLAQLQSQSNYHMQSNTFGDRSNQSQNAMYRMQGKLPPHIGNLFGYHGVQSLGVDINPRRDMQPGQKQQETDNTQLTIPINLEPLISPRGIYQASLCIEATSEMEEFCPQATQPLVIPQPGVARPLNCNQNQDGTNQENHQRSGGQGSCFINQPNNQVTVPNNVGTLPNNLQTYSSFQNMSNLSSSINVPHPGHLQEGSSRDPSQLVPEKATQCKLCQKRFKDERTLRRHMRTHSENRPFECETCSKAFKYKSSYKGHMRIHTGERPYKCRFCLKSFRFLCNKNTHQRIHLRYTNGPRQDTKCRVCPRMFESWYARYKHEAVVHGRGVNAICKQRGTVFHCNICSKVYYSVSGMHKHRQTHKEVVNANWKVDFTTSTINEPLTSSEAQYKCQYCSNEFFTIHGRLKHEKLVHHSEMMKSSYKCRFCDKVYFSFGGRVKHERIFHGKRGRSDTLKVRAPRPTNLVFRCRFCVKKFLSAQGRIQHERAFHPKERENVMLKKCRFCSKQFFSFSGLRGHEIKDHKEAWKAFKEAVKAGKTEPSNRYRNDKYTEIVENEDVAEVEGGSKCQFCTRVYYTKDGLNKHIRLRHKEQRDEMIKNSLWAQRRMNKENECKCQYCPKVYYSIGGLRKHLRQKHRDLRENVKDSSKPRIPCRYCSKTYETMNAHRKHNRQKHPEQYEANKMLRMSGRQKKNARAVAAASGKGKKSAKCGNALNDTDNDKADDTVSKSHKRGVYKMLDADRRHVKSRRIGMRKASERRNEVHTSEDEDDGFIPCTSEEDDNDSDTEFNPKTVTIKRASLGATRRKHTRKAKQESMTQTKRIMIVMNLDKEEENEMDLFRNKKKKLAGKNLKQAKEKLDKDLNISEKEDEHEGEDTERRLEVDEDSDQTVIENVVHDEPTAVTDDNEPNVIQQDIDTHLVDNDDVNDLNDSQSALTSADQSQSLKETDQSLIREAETDPLNTPKSYTCVCSNSYSSLSALRKHERKKHNRLPRFANAALRTSYLCSFCPKSYLSALGLRKHQQLYHFDEETVIESMKIAHAFKCHYCPEGFNSNEELVKHITSEHEEEVSAVLEKRNAAELDQQEDCPSENGLNTSPDVPPRLLLMLSKSMYICRYCPNRYASLCGLKKHERLAHLAERKALGDPKVLSCRFCSVVSFSKLGIQRHEVNDHKEFVKSSEKIFPCNFCSNSYFSVSGKRKHERLAHQEILKEAKTHTTFVKKNKKKNKKRKEEKKRSAGGFSSEVYEMPKTSSSSVVAVSPTKGSSKRKLATPVKRMVEESGEVD